MNQNEEQTNKLLQKLMVHCKLQQSAEVYRSYFSGVLKISEHSLKTLEVACVNFALPKSQGALQDDPPESPKLRLLKLLLAADNDKNYEALMTDVAARVVVSLVLKQYPKSSCAFNTELLGLCRGEFENTYITTTFESGLLLTDDHGKNVPEEIGQFQIVDHEQVEELQNLLSKLSYELSNAETSDAKLIKNLLTVVILYTNVISYMLLYLVYSESDLTSSTIYAGLTEALKKLSTNFCDFCKRCDDRKHMQEMVLILKMFAKLFHINVPNAANKLRFSYLLRETMPIEILQEIFLLRNKEIENESDGKKD